MRFLRVDLGARRGQGRGPETSPETGPETGPGAHSWTSYLSYISVISHYISDIALHGRINRIYSIIHQISLKLAGWVSTRYSTHLVPTPAAPPRVHLPCHARPWTRLSSAVQSGPWSKYGHGALIRRSTHFEATLVAVWTYDRGL